MKGLCHTALLSRLTFGTPLPLLCITVSRLTEENQERDSGTVGQWDSGTVGQCKDYDACELVVGSLTIISLG